MPVPTRSEWLQEGLRSNRWMFISGCPRSGTTIMIQAFAGLPNIQATNIGVFPTQVPAIYRNAPEDLRAAIEFLLAFNVVDYVDHRQRSRSDAIADSIAGRLSLRELIRAIGPHPSGAKPRQISALICKEPFLAFAPDLVERALPASCHLFLTRDGRDAADSLVRTYNILSDADLIDPRSNEVMQGRWRGRYCVPWWVDEHDEDNFLQLSQYCRAVYMWRSIVRSYFPYVQRGSIEEHTIIHCKYEEFVSSPFTEMTRLLQDSHLTSAVSKSIARRWSRFHPKSIGVHRTRSSAEVEQATALIEPELLMMGYKTS